MQEEKITYEKVREGIDTIEKCANTMEQIFNEFTGQAKSMTSDDTMQGEGRDAFSGELDEFKTVFPDYVSKVREFAKAYTAASAALKETEQEQARRVEEL